MRGNSACGRGMLARAQAQPAHTSKLVHEVRDNAVEVQPVVEAGVGKVDEVAHSDGHLLEVELALDLAHRRVEGDNRVGHGGDGDAGAACACRG